MLSFLVSIFFSYVMVSLVLLCCRARYAGISLASLDYVDSLFIDIVVYPVSHILCVSLRRIITADAGCTPHT